MKPYFSVIIPTLNEEEYIDRLLNDLVRQKDKNFETIVVDGNSEDKTKAKVRSFNKALPIKFYNIRKKNVSYQRNFGAAKAKGNFLIFLDADSSVTPLFTRNLKNEISKKKGLLLIPYILPEEKYPQVTVFVNLINFLIELSQNLNKPFSSGGVMFIEKNFFKLIGGFDVKLFLGEDHNLVQKAFNWGVRAKFLNNIKVKFSLRRMKREGQLTILYKWIMATIHILIKGDIKTKIYSYPMGGAYSEKIKKETSAIGNFRSLFKQVEGFLKKI